jgi:hypothetical protein
LELNNKVRTIAELEKKRFEKRMGLEAKLKQPFWEELVGQDTFDKKGDDISKEEFIEREIYYECL